MALDPGGASDIGTFVLLALPGLISLKVYALLIPTRPRDAASTALEAAFFGALNLLVGYSLFAFAAGTDFRSAHPILALGAAALVLFVLPVAWPILGLGLLRLRAVASRIRHPLPRPWDYVFGSRRRFWMRVHLKDGRTIGGYFGERSFASSFPEDPELYVEDLWRLDSDGNFESRVEGNEGIIILKGEIALVELVRG